MDLRELLLPRWKRMMIHVQSKHVNTRGFRATKAYADDRQKAPHNRRKHGRRKRTRS